MAPTETARSHRLPSAVEANLPLYRLHLMRVGYLVLGVGLAVVKWPLVVRHDASWPLMEGVVAGILTAMTWIPPGGSTS